MNGEIVAFGIFWWVIIALFTIIFMIGSGKNNKNYDKGTLQYLYFDKYLNSGKGVFVEYIGRDRREIQKNQYTFIVIDSTESTDNRICVSFEDGYIIDSYDNVEQFNNDWCFAEEF